VVATMKTHSSNIKATIAVDVVQTSIITTKIINRVVVVDIRETITLEIEVSRIRRIKTITIIELKILKAEMIQNNMMIIKVIILKII